MKNNGNVIELSDINLQRSGRSILNHVNFRASKGEHWAILGPNGSGKTTLLNIICGYTWPTSGSVTILGDRYGTVDIRDKRRSIGIVSSALFERIPPRETVRDVIMSGEFASLGIYNEVSEDSQSRADDIVHFLHCERIADRPYRVLSFGERQRALIGRALMAQPDILILDEPCEGLDITSREIILNRLDILIGSNNGPTILLVTHRVEEIPPGVTHAVVLKDGCVLASGEKRDTLTSDTLSRAMDLPLEIMTRQNRLYAVVNHAD